MSYFYWLKAVLRRENHSAILGSLKRRLFKRPFLAMHVSLGSLSPIESANEIIGFEPKFEESCLRILNSVGSLDFWDQNRFNVDILKSVKDPRSDIYLIPKDGEIVGMMVLHTLLDQSRPMPEIGFVAVAPWARGKNLGSQLLSHILQDAKKRGFSEIFLRTDAFRVRAIRTYIKAGFVPKIESTTDKKRWAEIYGALAPDRDLGQNQTRPT